MHRFTHPRTQGKGDSLIYDWIICKEDSFANLKASSEGQRLVGTFFRAKALVNTIFVHSLYLASIGGNI